MKTETLDKGNDLIKRINVLKNHQKRLHLKGDSEFDEERIKPRLVYYNEENFDSSNESIPFSIREKLQVESQDCARRMYKIIEKEKSILEKEFNNLQD